MSQRHKEAIKRTFHETSDQDISNSDSSNHSNSDSNSDSHNSESDISQMDETSRENLTHPLKKLQKENCVFTFETINPRDYVTDASHILVDQSNEFIDQPVGERVGVLLMQLLNGFKNVAFIHANMNTEIIKHLLNQGKLNYRDIFPLLESYYDAITPLIPLPAEMFSLNVIEPSFSTKITEHRHISENLIMLQNMWNQIQASYSDELRHMSVPVSSSLPPTLSSSLPPTLSSSLPPTLSSSLPPTLSTLPSTLPSTLSTISPMMMSPIQNTEQKPSPVNEEENAKRLLRTTSKNKSNK